MEPFLRTPQDVLREAARVVFAGNGSPEPEARLLADRLTQASLAGHDSHGILRVHFYMGQLRQGLIRPGAKPEITDDRGALVRVRGHRGYGQVVAEEGMRIAVERARKHGAAAVGVVDLTHIGRLADYVIAAARQGMLAMLFTATGGSAQIVAPFGGIARRLSTNPFAVAFPSRREYPVVFDMATSVIANGKLRVARDEGRAVKPGLLLDLAGHPSTDPADVDKGGAILPLGGERLGYKGYLLAFLVEVMGGLLTGGGFCGLVDDPIFCNPSTMLALDVTRFRPLREFQDELDALIAFLKATPHRDGEEVLYPGEMEERCERDRRAHGIPLPMTTIRNLQGELDKVGSEIKLEARAVG